MISPQFRPNISTDVILQAQVDLQGLLYQPVPPSCAIFPPPNSTDLHEVLQSACDHPRLMFDHFLLLADGGFVVAAGIIAGTAAGISDGSAHYIDQYGALAWKLFKNDSSLCSIDGTNWVAGPHSCQEAYQS